MRHRRFGSWGLGIGIVALLAMAATSIADAQGESGAAESLGGPEFGAWSLLPAALTLIVAFWTRQVLVALALGVASGAVVLALHTGEPSDLNVLQRFLLPALGSETYAKILLVYLWFLGGILGVWERTGGARYFAERVGVRLARGPRGASVFAWIIGCVFHQGGTVSTVLAGTTVRPVSDRHRVSHEELSYIVDSTASPVATILPFNAWPIYIGGLVAGVSVGGFVLIETESDGIAWFWGAIRFNFYALFAVGSTLLFSLGALPWTGRRMRAARERSRATGALDSPTAEPLLLAESAQKRSESYRTGLEDFFVPLGILLGVAIGPYVLSKEIWISEAFMACTLSAMLLARFKGMPLREVLEGFVDGCRSMTFGALILGLAVTLSFVSKELRAADFLVENAGGVVPAWSLPAVLTGLCMLVSFSIGSSFGTYAVIFPIAIPLALTVAIGARDLGGVPVETLSEVHPAEWSSILTYVSVCFGAVLGGAVFGDQCSPISDTTILSAMFTGCDLLDHVRTQLPLALAAAGLGAICSTIAALVV